MPTRQLLHTSRTTRCQSNKRGLHATRGKCPRIKISQLNVWWVLTSWLIRDNNSNPPQHGAQVVNRKCVHRECCCWSNTWHIQRVMLWVCLGFYPTNRGTSQLLKQLLWGWWWLKITALVQMWENGWDFWQNSEFSHNTNKITTTIYPLPIIIPGII